MAKKEETTKKTKKVTKEEVKKDNLKSEEKEEKKEVKNEEKEQPVWLSALELVLIIIAIVVILVAFPNTIVWNIVVLLLILTLLIFVHEFGHFIMAKIFGVHVYEFALGMGPKVLGFRRKNDPTLYSLRALPIGGYCQMAGEEGEDDSSLKKDKFMCNKSKIQRILILVAGVTMNFIIAFVLLFIIAFAWGSTEQTSIIGIVAENSPAAEKGIVPGDKIIECNGKKVSTWDDLSVISILKNPNSYNEYVIKHKDGTKDTYKITPAKYVMIEDENIQITEENTLEDILKEYDLKEEDVTVSTLVGVGAPTEKKYGVVNSLKYAFTKFGSIVSMMFAIIGSLITGKIGLSALSGPVGMYTVVGTAAKYGLANIIYLAAYLSINLGIMNILPFPAFDGGRVVFVFIEAITKKKVNPNVEGIFHTVGFILLMILMLYITFQDILRLL